jgi:hypothetical protein
MKDITKLDNYDLIEYFKDAIKDRHYNPSDIDYNKSGFKLWELEEEIMSRMTKE